MGILATGTNTSNSTRPLHGSTRTRSRPPKPSPSPPPNGAAVPATVAAAADEETRVDSPEIIDLKEQLTIAEAQLASLDGLDSSIARQRRDTLLAETIALRHRITMLKPLEGPRGRIEALQNAVDTAFRKLESAQTAHQKAEEASRQAKAAEQAESTNLHKSMQREMPC